MSCPYITRVWFGSQLNINITSTPITNFPDWIIYSIKHYEPDIIIQIASLAYHIWFSRNQRVFENKRIPEVDIINRAAHSIRDFYSAHHLQHAETAPTNASAHSSNSSARFSKPSCKPKWTKPADNLVKANSDANLQIEGWWGLGSIVRDAKGLVLATATWQTPGVKDVMFAEAFALMKTMRLAIDCGFRRVLFEGDNEKLMKRIQTEELEDRSYLGFIMKEIQVLQSLFDTCQCNFINREANATTHSLAHLAHSNPNEIWIEEVPEAISDVYVTDILNI